MSKPLCQCHKTMSQNNCTKQLHETTSQNKTNINNRSVPRSR